MELFITVRSRESDLVSQTQCHLNGSLILGRGTESPLLLEGAGISREHFRLHSESDRIFVTDLSSNGTWVNARRLSPGESHPVTSLDAIQIPGFEIRIEVPEPVKAPEQVKVDETPAPPPEPLAPEAAEPQQGALAAGSVRTFLDSFSTLEKLLIVLALLTLTLVVIYLAA